MWSETDPWLNLFLVWSEEAIFEMGADVDNVDVLMMLMALGARRSDLEGALVAWERGFPSGDSWGLRTERRRLLSALDTASEIPRQQLCSRGEAISRSVTVTWDSLEELDIEGHVASRHLRRSARWFLDIGVTESELVTAIETWVTVVGARPHLAADDPNIAVDARRWIEAVRQEAGSRSTAP